jgi:hypothetical protein
MLGIQKALSPHSIDLKVLLDDLRIMVHDENNKPMEHVIKGGSITLKEYSS